MNGTVYDNFPAPGIMRSMTTDPAPLKVNGHFHTPYSFSAFDNVKQVFEMARTEGVKVLGINDFYTTDGYGEFCELAKVYRIFPLFNIEFMALRKDLQAAGIRVNDPNNPGRTYFSGKGLKYPVMLDENMAGRLRIVQDESNTQTARMVNKLNDFVKSLNIDLSFSFERIKKDYAVNLVRERHIAKAIRNAVSEAYADPDEQKACFEKLFAGKGVKSAMSDFAGIENEIRGNLLKAGGQAFVPEDDKAFLSLGQVIELIVHAGGIPCYPVLLDDDKGGFTDYERDYRSLYENLVAAKIFSIELIPGRNNPAILEPFVKFFDEKGFVVTFGTEHNTPKLEPVTVRGADGQEMSADMVKINYEGACVVAAHQYLTAMGEEGYLDISGKAKTDRRNEFITLGNKVIKLFVG